MNAELLIFCITLTLVILVGYFSTPTEGFKSKKKKKKDPLDTLKKIPKFFTYLGKFFTWIGDMIKCGYETIIGLPNCIFFYGVDIVVGFFTMVIKFLCSFSPALESARRSLWGLIKNVDKHVKKFTGYHFIQWPNSVNKKCYKCKNKKMPKMPKL